MYFMVSWCVFCICIFFFKQKTAYEMRISDWSSDVCSSDLLTSSFDYAGPMTETVLMGNLAIRSYLLRKKNDQGQMEFFGRRKLLWDGENMRITNLEEANQFVGRTYRKGFEV